MKIDEFKEATQSDNIRCAFCDSETKVEIINHFYEMKGTILKFTYFCEKCGITVDGRAY